MNPQAAASLLARRRAAASAALALLFLVCLLVPDPAFAHASERGHVLLLPTRHYLVGGALAVAASFLALIFLPPAWLERIATQRLDLFNAPERLRLVTSSLGLLVFLVLVAAGFFGSRDPLSNPLPLTVWTLLWVGLTLVQGVVGDLWRWIDPWYAPWRLASWASRGRTIRLPASLGYWPAFTGLAAFAWFELIYPAPDDPAVLACVAGVYWLGSFALMLVFGHDAWSRRGEFLSVFFRMIARLAILGRSKPTRSEPGGRTIALGWPGARLWQAAPLPVSGIAFLLLALSSVSFDGLSRTFFWLGRNNINPLEFPGRTAMMGINGAGLALAFAALALAFLAAILLGEKLAHSRQPFVLAAGLLVWSIVPIALAYHFSHYLTALLVNGQYALAALSDPLARDWDLLGMADFHVHAAIATGSSAAWVIWNLQAGGIILGHVLAVLIAHGLAFRLHPDASTAARSQMPLTLLMIAYTVLGLWLLSTPTVG